MPQSNKHLYEFGPFRIDVTERTLLRQGDPLPLTPKAFDTLLYLVQNSGHTLGKDELMKSVWPDTVVEENNLTQNVSVLRRTLGDEFPYIETVPRRGYRFMARVTERWEPIPELIVRERTRSTVIIEEEEEVVPQPLEALGPAKAARKLLTLQTMAAGVMVLVLTIAMTYYFFSWRRGHQEGGPVSGSTPPALAFRKRPSVAVLGLTNLTQRPEAGWLSTALSEMLTTELGAGEGVRMIPGENIARMKAELPLANTNSLSKDTLEKIHKDLGTDYVLLGSYTALGEGPASRIRLDLRLQDATAGETVAVVGETGTQADLFGLVQRTGKSLREKLGVGDVPASAVDQVRASLPSNPQARRLYAEGLAELRTFDAVSARSLLEKAVALEPSHPLAHSALATAWSSLGYDAKAREEAKKAFDLSSGLDDEHRLMVEGRYREMSNQWNAAIENYRTLFGLYPDNLEYGLRLAYAQITGSKLDDANVTLKLLRELPAPQRDDPRVDLAEAYLADSLSDYKRSESAASRAANKALMDGARLVAANAWLELGTALSRLGELPKAAAVIQDARQAFAAAGNQEGVAQSLHLMGETLEDEGDLAGAKQNYERELEIRRATGDLGGAAAALNDLASIYWDQGDLAGAQKTYDEALAGFRVVGDRRGAANVLNNLGNVLFNEGHLASTKAMYDEALAMFREIDDQGGVALGLNNIGLVLYEQGDLAGATKAYQESLAAARATGIQRNLAYALYGLGEIWKAQGDLSGARKWHQQALEIRNQLGEKGPAAESEMELAVIALEEGQPAEAEKTARAAADEFEKGHEPDDQACALAIVARALLRQGQVAEAGRVARRAVALAEQSQNRGARLAAAIAAARVQAQGPAADSGSALRSLRTTAKEAQGLGYATYALEAELALGETEMRAGLAQDGRADLLALSRRADQIGFKLVARRAAALLK